MDIRSAPARRLPALLLLAALAALAGPAAAQSDPMSKAIDGVVQTNRAAAQSQDRIDQLDAATRKMLERYRAALWQSQQLTVYGEQLGQLLDSQETEQQSLERQLAEMDRAERDLLPLLLRMLDSLEEFVQLDLPFLQREREERVAGLRRMMADAEMGVAEKYRRILEAYQIESEYGRTLGGERAEVEGKVVDILRVGRVALYALTLDSNEALAWDEGAGRWTGLERRYIPQLRKGLKIARETAAAELLTLPVRRAERVP